MHKRYNHYNETFQAAFTLWLGDEDACIRHFTKPGFKPLDRPEGTAGWCQCVVSENDVVEQHLIFLLGVPTTPAEYGILVHELLHAAEDCLRVHGVHFGTDSPDGDETLAYLVSELYRDFVKQITKGEKK